MEHIRLHPPCPTRIHSPCILPKGDITYAYIRTYVNTAIQPNMYNILHIKYYNIMCIIVPVYTSIVTDEDLRGQIVLHFNHFNLFQCCVIAQELPDFHYLRLSNHEPPPNYNRTCMYLYIRMHLHTFICTKYIMYVCILLCNIRSV